LNNLQVVQGCVQDSENCFSLLVHKLKNKNTNNTHSTQDQILGLAGEYI